MKKIWQSVLLASFCMLLFLGCSSSENKPASSDQRCSALIILSGGKTKREPVTCAAPLRVMSVYGQSRSQIEQVLGPPRSDISSDISAYYKDGGIRIIYEGNTSNTIILVPENLPLTPEAVLNFIGMSGMSAEANVSSTLLQWENDPTYPDVTADTARNGPAGVVHQIYIK